MVSSVPTTWYAIVPKQEIVKRWRNIIGDICLEGAGMALTSLGFRAALLRPDNPGFTPRSAAVFPAVARTSQPAANAVRGVDVKTVSVTT